jgi:glycine/D-amino acid oxidase-like deaminating enzyme/nitrite reductase/ring-hydroxylating ferredoxin subunit
VIASDVDRETSGYTPVTMQRDGPALGHVPAEPGGCIALLRGNIGGVLRDARSSLWLGAVRTRFPQLDGSISVDVAVLGGGITGLTAAYLLKRAGKTVALAEMGTIGQGTTGNTTAKLTVGHSLIYTDLLRDYGEEVARLYAESNRAAIDRIEQVVEGEGIACDLERADNYIYTESSDRVAAVGEEAQAARRAGINAQLTTEADLPFPVLAAVRVEGQAQFHPGKYLSALADGLGDDGSHVFEQTRATAVRSGETCLVETTSGVIRAKHVVVATHMPFLDRGLFFAKAHPEKSYAIAGRLDEPSTPRSMYISVDRSTRSIRSAPGPDGSRYLIIGGEGHKPGDEPDSERPYVALERFMRERFGGEPEYRWSAHDFSPVDRLPYVGRLRRRDERIHVATGFAKWGLTKGTFAAEIIADSILGKTNRWAHVYDSRRLNARRSARRFAKENGHVARHFVSDRLKPRDGESEVKRLGEREGTIARIGSSLYAIYRDDEGALHTLSPRCTHLGCLVAWNGADQVWECPCHGSRFAADGTLAQGPATRDLKKRSLPVN